MGGAMGMFMQQMMGNRQQAMGGAMGMFMQQMMGSNGVGAAMAAGGNHMMLQMFQQFLKQQVMAQMAGKVFGAGLGLQIHQTDSLKLFYKT